MTPDDAAPHLSVVPNRWGDVEEPDDHYQADTFYTTSTDKKGHSAQVRTSIPPEMHSQIKRLIESGDFPMYQTMGDFVRDAIFHRVHWVAKNKAHLLDGELDRVARRSRLYHQLDEHQAFQERMRTLYTDLLESLTEADENRDKQAGAVCLRMARDCLQAEDLPDFHHNRLTELINQYSYLDIID